MPVVHLDEGFDFLGFTVKRRRKRGTGQRQVYTYPSEKALCFLETVMPRLTTRSSTTPPWLVLHRLNAVLRGWANYFRHGVSKRTFSNLDSFAWRRVSRWLRKWHHGLSWKAFDRRFLRGWDIVVGQVTLFMPSRTPVTRYRYRRSRIPTPWTERTPLTV